MKAAVLIMAIVKTVKYRVRVTGLSHGPVCQAITVGLAWQGMRLSGSVVARQQPLTAGQRQLGLMGAATQCKLSKLERVAVTSWSTPERQVKPVKVRAPVTVPRTYRPDLSARHILNQGPGLHHGKCRTAVTQPGRPRVRVS